MRGRIFAWLASNSGRALQSSPASTIPLQTEPRLIRRAHLGALTRGFHQGASEDRASPWNKWHIDHDPREDSTSANDIRKASGRNHKDDTLTDSERAIFQQIYQDAAERSAQRSLSEEGRVEQLIGDMDQSQKSDESLSTIFERARDVIERNDKTRDRPPGVLDAHRRPEADPRRIPPELLQSVPFLRVQNTLTGPELPGQIPSSVRQSLRLNLDQSDPSVASSRGNSAPSRGKQALDSAKIDKRDAAITEACSKDASRVHDLIKNADTDTEIWLVLQEEVFVQVELFLKNMNKELERAGELKGSSSIEKKRGRQPKRAPSELSSIRALSIATSPDKYPQLALPFAVIRANYAHHCWTALRILRVRFPRSPYATAILPKVKSLGPISYVLGASTELYNELMFLRWAHYKDLQACADLLAEMLNRGIPTNHGTRAVFRDAARRWLSARRMSEEKGTKKPEPVINKTTVPSDSIKSKYPVSPFELAWWSLEGIQSGFKRWEGLEVAARRRQHEEIERHKREMQDAEEDERELDNGSEKPVLGQGS